MKTMKRPAKTVLCILFALLLVAAVYLVYVLVSYHRIGDQTLTVTETDTTVEPIEPDAPYHLVSWNIGFGAYEPDYSFFMDGGTQSWAWSKERLVKNLSGISSFIGEQYADLLLVQEVDIDGTRSYHVDECEYIAQGFAGDGDAYNAVFAQNYDSPFLFYPFTQPHGANESGLLTLARFPIAFAARRELPVETSLMKLVDLDRCYSVSRIPIECGTELVLYNLHLSAYTSDGTVAVEQLELLLSDMKAEYAAGNYCIAGGDFNKDLPGNSGELFGVPVREGDTWAQPIPEGTVPDGLTLVVPLYEDTPAASCRTAAEPYTPGSTFRVTVDGFVVSDNVTVIDSKVIETDYAYSDHNPVYLDFVLQ